MHLKFFLISVSLWWMVYSQGSVSPVRRPIDYRGLTEMTPRIPSREPTCVELRAMWRSSNRLSKVSDMTNELPTFKDPFTDNFWTSNYDAKLRSGGGLRIGGRYNRKPVYGLARPKIPVLHVRDSSERSKGYEDIAQGYGNMDTSSRPPQQPAESRFFGRGYRPLYQHGSFQYLKELVRAERARELQEQRMIEDDNARVTALRRLTSGRGYHPPLNYQDYAYPYDDQYNYQPENYEGEQGIMVFPDLLAPAARPRHEDMESKDFYSNDKASPAVHTSSFFENHYANDDSDTMTY